MEGLNVITWRWGDKYSADYVDRLAHGVSRNLEQPHKFVVMQPTGSKLLEHPGCFIRLQMFDPSLQAKLELAGRIVCIDLDVVITGKLDPLFDRPEPLVILQGANSSNPCPYNGSLIMFRSGQHAELWNDFSLEAAGKIPFDSFPDDQGWIAHKVPNAAGWTCGAASGVYAFRKRGWPSNDALPADARLVAFPGRADPAQFTGLPWIKQHWI